MLLLICMIAWLMHIFAYNCIGYIVEKMPAKKPGASWIPVTSTPVSGTSFKVGNLPQDSEWEFRVVAVNKAGPGKPSKSTGPHRVRDPVCKFTVISAVYYCLPKI